MKMLVTVLIYLVCILLAMSLSQETAQALFPGTRGMSIVSNVNFISAPFITSQSNDTSSCDYSSYPDFCIPPPPPPLNCDDVDEKDFTVFPPDPHGFDRDKGGESCETSE
jgi:hypothetical protein